MTPERWDKINEIFHEALDVERDSRSSWLERRCQSEDPGVLSEVRSLLANDGTEAVGFVREHVEDALRSFHKSSQPERAGPYRLVGELGAGGMGTVYLAERDDQHYETKVAVKLVRPGMDTEFILERFRRERQTLAHLQHPHIARLLDGGTTDDGMPYIVMEYIRGVSITRYCRDQQLSIEQILRLFLNVCDAVAYAHRHFVVHRDLKPGNVLVDETGSAKLLDFGICKLLYTDPLASPETIDAGARLMTPDYASPEQIRGDVITISSDIYSLGAILYELLTGTKAHRIEKYTPLGLELAICDREVLRPSLAAQTRIARNRLKGDLDTILLKALEKAASMRYPSVEQFAEDIRRHLDNLPIRARPATAAYQARKFLLRHRTVVATTAIMVASLTAAVVVSVRETQAARAALLDLRQLANHLVFDVHDAIKDLPGSTRARQMIVGTGLRYLDVLSRTTRGDRQMKAELAGAYRRIGDVQGNLTGSNLGGAKDALESYRQAVVLLDELASEAPRDIAAQRDRVVVRRRIADIYAETQAGAQALANYRQAIALGEEALQTAPNDVALRRELADTYVNSGDTRRLLGDYAGAREDVAKGVALLAKMAEDRPNDRLLHLSLSMATSSLGTAESLTGQLQPALMHFRQAAERVDRLVEADPNNISYRREQVLAYGHIGDVLGNPNMPNLGDTKGAVAAYQRVVEGAHVLYQVDRADQRALLDYAISLSRLSAVLPADQTRYRATLIRHSIDLLTQASHQNSEAMAPRMYLAFEEQQMGDVLREAGEHGSAAQAYERSLRWAEGILTRGSAAPYFLYCSDARRLGELAAQNGEREKALRYARSLMQLNSLGNAPANIVRILTPRQYGAQGFIYLALSRSPRARSNDDRAQAQQWLSKAAEGWRQAERAPEYGTVHRRESQEVNAALAALNNSEKQ